MKDTVIFDLDGTLLNTLDDLLDSVNYMLTVKGYTLKTYAEVREYVGNGVRMLVERALPIDRKHETDECLKIFEQHYDKNKANKTAPYEGIYKMLGDVKADGFRTAVVSNKYDAAVKGLCTDLFGELIDVAIGESAAVSKKPAPDGVFAAMSYLLSDNAGTVYVGDSDVDVMTAKSAGITMIGVTWGFRDRELLESLGADYIIESPLELIELLRKL